MPDENQTTSGGYPANIENPDDWAAFLARYCDNRATNAVHNGIGLVALHIADAIRDARSDAADRITDLTARLAESNAAADAEMERVKACEHIAEGTDGWPVLRNLCPSTAAVSALRDAYETAAMSHHAELERATPEEVVEMAARALRTTSLLVPGTLFDLLCTTTYANDHVIALLLSDAAANAVAAIAPTLRRQGAAVERERCAQLAFDQQPFPGDWNEACLHIAARIRAGGSGG